MIEENDSEDPHSSRKVEGINSAWRRWGKPLAWVVAVFGLLIGYLFGYPALILTLLDSDVEPPEWLGEILFAPLIPLIWLYDNFTPYSKCIDWIAELIM